MSALLRLDGIGHRFGGLAVLDDVSMTVEAGGCHAIIGPNGAGKSTLINVIAGALRPSVGSVVFDGRDITRESAARRVRHGIGRTFQHPAVFGRLSVGANVSLALTRHNPVRVARLVEDAGLAEHAHTRAGRLPYGLRRRLELAMALATTPRLLLLDEPSAGLDPDENARLTTQLRELAGHTTVVLVDHNLDLVWSLADTVTVLHHGRHLATGTADTIRRDPRVHDAYLAHGHQPPIRPSGRSGVTGPVLLRVRDLRAGYQGAPVLKGIDVDVHDGEAVAILGRNGAGKTTLLNTIAGLLPAWPPSAVELAGRALPLRRAHQPARAGIAIVPEGRRLFGPLTVTEHLTCAHNPHPKRPIAGPQWTVDRVLALLPALAARAHHPAQRLSGGEQQMLALARALLTNPRLLILDEPSEGLAPTVIGHLTATLSALVNEGLAVLIAEQNLPLATAITNRVIVLDRGRIAMTASTTNLTEPPHRQRLNALLGVADTTDAHRDETR